MTLGFRFHGKIMANAWGIHGECLGNVFGMTISCGNHGGNHGEIHGKYLWDDDFMEKSCLIMSNLI
jgi:hypothetical protein